MQTFLTLRDGRKILMNTPEEDAAITAAALTDPDAQPLTDAELAQLRPMRGRPALETPRKMLSLRVDQDVLDKLRASGKGWQTRLNAVLREVVEQGRL